MSKVNIFERLWNSSPASLRRAIQRRARDRKGKPGWYTVKAGPAVGTKLFLPHNLDGAWREMEEGTFDSFLYEELARHGTLRGALCWDVGAHIGFHSFGFAGLGSQVVAFEPTPQNAARFKLHLEKNPQAAERIRLLELALSDRDGEVTFMQCAEIATGSSGSHLTDAIPPLAAKDYADFGQITVAAATIDTLVQKMGERPPDVLKIDVEGGEWLVLQGARKVLETKKPLILMEVHHIRLMFEVMRFLPQIGYSAHILNDGANSPSRCFISASAGR